MNTRIEMQPKVTVQKIIWSTIEQKQIRKYGRTSMKLAVLSDSSVHRSKTRTPDMPLTSSPDTLSELPSQLNLVIHCVSFTLKIFQA